VAFFGLSLIELLFVGPDLSIPPSIPEFSIYGPGNYNDPVKMCK
jgi:hypothetical protein